MQARFDGKVALVTGAASGIGLAIAQRMASEGACVVAVDVQRDLVAQCAEAIMAAVSERGDEYVTRCIDRAAEVAGGGGPSLSLLRRIIAEGVHETGVARQRATAGRAGSSAGVSDWGGATTTDGWGDG